MIPFLLAVLFVVLGTVAYVALRNAQDFSDANQIIPGVPTRAPKEWAGAHTPEARLHRRLRDTMEVVRANATMDDASLADLRQELERQALATDDRLVAVAALPKGQREAPLDAVAKTVESIEGAVTSVVLLRGPSVTDQEAELEAVRTRVRLVAEARAELDALAPGGPDLTDLRDRLEADAVGPPAETEPPDEQPGGTPTP